jgi:hypothetical protein
MGIHRGPNMEKGGLVFGYDSGHGVCDNHTSSRFYQGKPTTNTWNKNSHSYTSGNITATRNATPPVPPPLEAQGFEVYKLQSNDGGLNQGIMGTSNVVNGVGGNYVHSVYCYLESGTIVTVGQHWNPWAYGDTQNPPLGRWVRLSQTVTNDVNNYGNVANAYRTNGVAYFTAPQYELGSVVTPHVDGDRPSTESLIDLKRTTDIDMSNLSFDSTGQPVFDGTNDYLVTDEDFLIKGNQTWEIVAMANGGPDSPAGILTNHHFQSPQSNFGINYVSGSRLGASIGYTNGSREYASKNTSYVIQENVPFHAVLKYDSSNNTIEWFINGVSDSTYSLSSTPNFIPQPICSGRWTPIYNDYYFNGAVYVGKVYGRALTSDEIKQNYNSYKNRFNL